MAECTANFEAGTNGNTITTGAGEASATAWDSVSISSATAIYDTTHVAQGVLAGKIVAGQGKSVELGWKAAIGVDLTDYYGRLYLYATANPSSAMYIWTGRYTGFGTLVSFVLNTDGTITGRDSSQATRMTFTTAIALNQWVRYEYRVRNTAGQIRGKLFNTADSTVPTETQASATGLNFGGATDEIRFGDYNTSAGGDYTLWLDALVAAALGYPGPAPVPPVPPVTPPVAWLRA